MYPTQSMPEKDSTPDGQHHDAPHLDQDAEIQRVPPSNEEILASLCSTADLKDDNQDVRDCLRAYKLGLTEKAYKTVFNRFNKDTLIKTLLFLNVDKGDWENILKTNVINELICRIQNLLLDNCGMCLSNFATGIDEISLLQCEMCGQGIHRQCLKSLLGDKFREDITPNEVKLLINPYGLEGIHYLCNSCSKTSIPTDCINLKDNLSNNVYVAIQVDALLCPLKMILYRTMVMSSNQTVYLRNLFLLNNVKLLQIQS